MSNFTAIILAAGQGTRLRPLTDNIPKCMVEVAGKSLIEWQLETMKKCGIKKIIVVTGYKQEVIPANGVTKVYNKDYAKTNMIVSLFCAEEHVQGNVIISYGDIIYSERVLNSLMENRQDIVIASDEDWLSYWESRCDNPLDDAESFKKANGNKVSSLGKKARSIKEIEGQYIGLIKLSPKGSKILKEEYQSCYNNEVCKKNAWHSGRDLKDAFMTDLMNYLASKDKLYFHPINRGWFEIDNFNDLNVANKNITQVIND
jgi:L-glutamine-phosphate cytidylyltransferase